MSYGDLIQAFVSLGGLSTEKGEPPILTLVKQYNNDSEKILASSPFCSALLANLLRKNMQGTNLSKEKLKDLLKQVGLKTSVAKENLSAVQTIYTKIRQRREWQQLEGDYLAEEREMRLAYRQSLLNRKFREMLPRGKIVKRRGLSIASRQVVMKSGGKRLVITCKIKDGVISISKNDVSPQT